MNESKTNINRNMKLWKNFQAFKNKENLNIDETNK